jgi:serine phosphatase RsbU (regulator of sigma subunit)
LVAGPDGTSRLVGRPGTLLGAVADPSFESDDVVLGADETLLLYTDGVTEARTPSGLLGMDGLRALIRKCPNLQPEPLVACIVSHVHGGEGHTVSDDMALLALRPR